MERGQRRVVVIAEWMHVTTLELAHHLCGCAGVGLFETTRLPKTSRRSNIEPDGLFLVKGAKRSEVVRGMRSGKVRQPVIYLVALCFVQVLFILLLLGVFSVLQLLSRVDALRGVISCFR